MSKRIVLDSGPLSQVAHPKAAKALTEWFLSVLDSDCVVFLPEIADYEVRRELIRAGKTRSVRRLDQVKEMLDYLPIDTRTMLQAATLWAEARRRGKPTADPKDLDGDVILAAQARLANAIVATNNIGHLDQFVDTREWRHMGFPDDRAE
ncbi:MAG: hypothetical protein Q7R41_11290 [Phycisphaerales bacterium]|nr:hypothetical protein [Phycisphaerales bacterium]